MSGTSIDCVVGNGFREGSFSDLDAALDRRGHQTGGDCVKISVNLALWLAAKYCRSTGIPKRRAVGSSYRVAG